MKIKSQHIREFLEAYRDIVQGEFRMRMDLADELERAEQRECGILEELNAEQSHRERVEQHLHAEQALREQTEQHLRSAEATLQEKDKEIERLKSECASRPTIGTQKEPLTMENSCASSDKEIQKMSDGFRPRLMGTTMCSPDCPANAISPTLALNICTRYSWDVTSLARAPKCIEEFGPTGIPEKQEKEDEIQSFSKEMQRRIERSKADWAEIVKNNPEDEGKIYVVHSTPYICVGGCPFGVYNNGDDGKPNESYCIKYGKRRPACLNDRLPECIEECGLKPTPDKQFNWLTIKGPERSSNHIGDGNKKDE